MNDLEQQLRSWAPRPPSANLEKRLFGDRREEAEPATPAFRLAWLAPATAAILVACLVFNQRGSAITPSGSGSQAMVAMILSNQSAAAYLPGSFEREHNCLYNDAFEWTNGSDSISSVRSVSRVRGIH
jgi:hypothetical protein